MNSEKAWNMFVFREGRTTVPGATLARDLAAAIRDVYSHGPEGCENSLMDALLRAGELECALCDAGVADAQSVAIVTDRLADALVNHCIVTGSAEELLKRVPERAPAQLKVSPPEGFAYYALHPLDYADMASEIPVSSATVCVIGIRSIGSTLSALVAAGLRQRGVPAVRFTVRPVGHPYDRKTEFDAPGRDLVRNLSSEGADFVVVDEGPGMSGSSFLSVGDALVELGASREKVVFICSRVADPDSLRATNGAARWRSYRSLHARKNSRLPSGAEVYIGGGDWRKFLLRGAGWPESWTQMERLKFLSPDHELLFKFEGFGRFGNTVNRRTERVAEAGFGPRPFGFAQGFSTYRVVQGRVATGRDLDEEMVRRLAEYCAFRARAFRWDGPVDVEQVETMVRFNLGEEFGSDSGHRFGGLQIENPVVADGRMMPHEWILTPDGAISKVDAGSHGDDHFFPGPTDIAWDVAGTIVEWGMSVETSDAFISEYVRLTGDDLRRRLPSFLVAYTVFRFAYCKMSAAVMRGTGEDHLLAAAYQRYRSMVGLMSASEVEPLAA